MKRIIHIEDNAIKHSQINRQLINNGIKDVYWAKDAKSGIEEIERANWEDDIRRVVRRL